MRRHIYMLAVALVALAVPSCNIFTDFGNAECKANNGVGCATGGSSGGMLACMSLGTSFFECNVVNGPNTIPIPINHDMHSGNCGSFYCAESVQDAVNQTGAAGDPSVSCVGLGVTAPAWTSCITPCNPCDDGQGGTLQSVGENCGGTSMCCQGLTCVGAGASTMGVCQGTPQCAQAQPNWQPLPTSMLRQIAIQSKVDGCDTQSGITQSRTIGLAFERWVLTTLGVVPSPPGPGKNTTSFMSPRRKSNTGGLPASVIPEFVGNQTMFPQSVLYEVKAVTGALTPGTSNWQILGLLDVANTQITKPAGPHPAPAVFFITTGNTTVSSGVVAQATMPAQGTMPMWSVAVWQQQVLYDANGGSNPNLTLGPPTCLTTTLCAPPAAVPSIPNPGPPVSPLTSPTTPPSTLLVPGDPDPPEVD
jgi:hypothetical protein